MTHFAQVLIGTEMYVREHMHDNLSPSRYFHNLAHTQSVARRCHEMAAFYNVPTEERTSLLLAAWFHDIGYCVAAENHEQYSVEIMTKFLEGNLSSDHINQIGSVIMATKLTARPSALIEQIICDADLHHVASKNYQKWSALLKLEVEHYNHISITDSAWNKDNIKFFNNHDFYTGYANFNWLEQKQHNLNGMKQRVSVLID